MSEYIWHYTSESTLIELLGKKKLEASNCLYGTLYNFCNDSAEISLGYRIISTLYSGDDKKIVRTEFSRIKKQWPENFSITFINKTGRLENQKKLKICPHQHFYLALIGNELKGMKKEEYSRYVLSEDLLMNYDVYIFCFTKDEDNLSQWRSYTPKEGGFSLGFNYNKITERIRERKSVDCDLKFIENIDGTTIYIRKDSQSVICFGNCIYNFEKDGVKDKIIKVYQKICSELVDNKNEFLKNTMGEKADVILSERNIAKLILSSFIKDKSFSAEKEVRLVLIKKSEQRNEIEFIGGKPRMKIDIDNLLDCVEKINISPHGDQDRHKKIVEIIGALNGKKYIVDTSCSTYNGK